MKPFGGWSLMGAAVGACLISSALVARADPLAQVTLHWQAPAPCPDVNAVQAQLSRDLQGSQSNEPLDADAHVERTGETGWSVLLRTKSAAGQSARSLSARSCQALADATSLIIAMQIDPETAATHARVIEGLNETVDASRTPPSAQPSQPLPATTAQPLQPSTTLHPRPAVVSGTKTKQYNPDPSQPSTATRARAPWRVLLGAWALRDWGTLPAGTEIFGGALGVSRDSWWAEVAVGASLREDLLQRVGPPVGTLAVATGELRLCRQVYNPSRFALAACSGLQWARWSSQGNENLANHRNASAVTLSAEGRIVAALALFEPIQLLVPLDVVLPLNRPRFGVIQAAERQLELFEPSWLALRIGVGVQVAFP